MAIKILSAHGSEQNLGINGAVGDQLQTSTPDTSGEIRIMDFYVDPLGWYVMRAKEEKERKAIAEAAEIAANAWTHASVTSTTTHPLVTVGIVYLRTRSSFWLTIKMSRRI